ncbi:MAG: DUF3536 domain-containing protein [Candidatus Omnitrophota bacterium]
MNRFICIHAHFYQPPRENPWLEEIELQDSAYPYHDWNEGIMAECYAPNTASRILNPDSKIIDIVNNYSKISFNFGPTLLSWMEKHNTEVYQAILEADKKSQQIFSGHGSAIAQAYNHIIMPLANSHDKRTQIIWGIKDFEYRFKRRPEGMWLAETAVDLETLEILAEHGIQFTILALGQAQKVRKKGEKRWRDVSGAKIDPKMPYECNLPSGKTIAILFYDGPLAQDVAFGNLLKSGENFAKKLLSAFTPENNNNHAELVHIATDGETYGHHHRFGDMALSYCLYYLESNNLAKITIYAEYLKKHPPEHEVGIFENTSWSCFHGIERWKSNCGCNSGVHQGWNQDWRAPLRGAMDWLRDNLIHIYEEQMSILVKDPWQARNEFIEVILNRSEENTKSFLSRHAKKELTKDEEIKVIELLEMQRNCLLMYTSCGWFFDEISGIETVQVMQYAARAMQLAKLASGISLEEAYIGLLQRAPSNIPDFQNGAKVYEMFVKPAVLDLLRVGVHYAVSSIFTDYLETVELYAYTVKKQLYDRLELGKQRLAIGKVSLRSNITWQEDEVTFAVLHLGDHNLIGGTRSFQGQELFSQMRQQLKESFSKSEISEVIRLIDSDFSSHSFSLWHLFRDEQRKIINQIFEETRQEMEASFRQIYQHHSAFIQATENSNLPLPRYLSSVIGFVLNTDIRRNIENEQLDIEQLKKLIESAKKWISEIDIPVLSLIASRSIILRMEGFSQQPDNVDAMQSFTEFIKAIEVLPLKLDLWKAQNIYFSLSRNLLDSMQKKARENQEHAKKWLEDFNRLGDCLKVKVV